DIAAQRVAGDYAMLDVQPIKQRSHETNVGCHAVVAGGRWTGETKSRQIEADDAVPAAQCAGPAFPRVQAGRGAVDQDDGNGIGGGPLIAQMHIHSRDLYE